MIIAGYILIVLGSGSTIYGIFLSNNLEARLESLWYGGVINPGAIWIVAGIIALAVGIVLIVAGKKKATGSFPKIEFNFSTGAKTKRICPNCGRELKESTAFCPYCGTKIEATEPGTNEKPKKERKSGGESNRHGQTTTNTDFYGFEETEHCRNATGSTGKNGAPAAPKPRPEGFSTPTELD